MRDKVKAFFRRSAVMPIAALLVVLIIVGSVTAEFTFSYRAKRVIAADGSGDMLFSSNYMRKGETTIDQKGTIFDYYTTTDSGTVEDILITVNNFARGNNTRWNERDITYQLKAQIVKLGANNTVRAADGADLTDLTGDNVVKIGFGDEAKQPLNAGNSYTYQFTAKTLDNGNANTDSYYLDYPAALREKSNYYVLLKAEPTEDVDGASTISVLLNVRQRQSSVSQSWTLVRQDNTVGQANTVDKYSGFRWQLQGNGTGWYYLAWDSSKIEISQRFLNKYSAAPQLMDLVESTDEDYPTELAAQVTQVSGNRVCYKLHVDSGTVNSYDIQFYRVSSNSVNSWNDTIVKGLFVEDAPAESGSGEGD